MSMQNEGREERRRRIAERECDRMAFINGLIHNLPPPTATSNAMDDSSDFNHSGSLKNDKSGEDSRKSLTIEDQVERNLFNNSTGIEPTAIVGGRTDTRPSQATITLQKASIIATPSARTITNRPKLFTSKRINSCIIDSQNSRVICSLIIALLVVLSYVDYPLFGRNIVKSESVIASKPLYILLLTDVTIVLARMFLERRRDPAEGEEEGEVAQEDRQNWEAAVKVLERGLVIYQAFRGIFIDFSIYAVVVICGLSLV